MPRAELSKEINVGLGDPKIKAQPADHGGTAFRRVHRTDLWPDAGRRPDRGRARHGTIHSNGYEDLGRCIAPMSEMQYASVMKTLTVRLPEALVAQIEAESRRRKLSKSDVVRERLTAARGSRRRRTASLDTIADLVGAVDGLPRDLSARTKRYLKSTGYGDKLAR